MTLSLLLTLTLQSAAVVSLAEWSDKAYEELAAKPPHLSMRRLPAGYKIGQCLLIVDGLTRISGPCAYIIYKGGGFQIDGPRQVYQGIDYPKTEGAAAMVSTDYWANIFKDEQGNWTGYGNENTRYTNGQGSVWGKLSRSGACYSNTLNPPKTDEFQQSVKLCLWKEVISRP